MLVFSFADVVKYLFLVLLVYGDVVVIVKEAGAPNNNHNISIDKKNQKQVLHNIRKAENQHIPTRE
jgi:hypothetical protein